MSKDLFAPGPLNSETIGRLDEGAAGMAIDLALAKAIRDVEDRGNDGKARSVTIKISVKKDIKRKERPVLIDVDVSESIPKLTTGQTIAKLSLATGKPEVIFSPASSANPDQSGLPVDEESGEIRGE